MPSRHHLLLISAVLFLLSLSLTPSLPSTLNHEPESDPISRFQNYLRINTAHPTPNYTAAVNYLTSIAATIPTLQIKTLYLTTPDKPLLLITFPGSNPSLPAVLFNSHLDSVPAEPSKWIHDPFAAHLSNDGKIYARGAQDDKCIGMQYLEAIKELKESDVDFFPLRTVHISYVPEEEVGGFNGMAKFVESKEFKELNIGFMLDEGQASVSDEFRVFYADRQPWHLVIKATGEPGHGARMFDNSAMENMMKSVEVIMKFRENQFDLVKAGLAPNSEVISANPVFLKAGTSSPSGFVMNMQPSEVEAGFDVRLPPTVDPNLMRKRIEEEWAPSWRNMSYEITEKGSLRDYMGRPLMTAANNSNPWWSVFPILSVIRIAGKKRVKMADKQVMIIALDAGEHSFYALEWTLDHFFAPAACTNFKLVVIHARSSASSTVGLAGPGATELLPIVDADMKKSAERVIAKAKEACNKKSVSNAHFEVIEGDARNVMVDAVDKYHASVLVLGSHGYGAFARAVLGSVSDYCAHHAHCSVMIVKMPKLKH